VANSKTRARGAGGTLHERHLAPWRIVNHFRGDPSLAGNDFIEGRIGRPLPGKIEEIRSLPCPGCAGRQFSCDYLLQFAPRGLPAKRTGCIVERKIRSPAPTFG
jgi:hypothetical protein